MSGKKEVRKENWDTSMCAFVHAFVYVQCVSAVCSNVKGMLWDLRFCGEQWEKNSLAFCRKLLTELCSVDLQ